MSVNSAFLGLVLVAVFALTGCFFTHEPKDAAGLAACYRRQFGIPPPPSVAGLQAKELVVQDTGAEWLRFKADAAVVDEIIAMGFVASSRAEFSRETAGANTPSWWKPDADGLTHYYIHQKWPSQFLHSVAVLAHDKEKHVVYFQHEDF